MRDPAGHRQPMPVRSENRARIVIEILEALIGVWGPGRVGV
jgi:hypothetical protein